MLGMWYKDRSGWLHVRRCWSTSRVQCDTLDNTAFLCAAVDRVEPELVTLPEKALARDAMERLCFVVHAVG